MDPKQSYQFTALMKEVTFHYERLIKICSYNAAIELEYALIPLIAVAHKYGDEASKELNMIEFKRVLDNSCDMKKLIIESVLESQCLHILAMVTEVVLFDHENKYCCLSDLSDIDISSEFVIPFSCKGYEGVTCLAHELSDGSGNVMCYSRIGNTKTVMLLTGFDHSGALDGECLVQSALFSGYDVIVADGRYSNITLHDIKQLQLPRIDECIITAHGNYKDEHYIRLSSPNNDENSVIYTIDLMQICTKSNASCKFLVTACHGGRVIHDLKHRQSARANCEVFTLSEADDATIISWECIVTRRRRIKSRLNITRLDHSLVEMLFIDYIMDYQCVNFMHMSPQGEVFYFRDLVNDYKKEKSVSLQPLKDGSVVHLALDPCGIHLFKVMKYLDKEKSIIFINYWLKHIKIDSVQFSQEAIIQINRRIALLTKFKDVNCASSDEGAQLLYEESKKISLNDFIEIIKDPALIVTPYLIAPTLLNFSDENFDTFVQDSGVQQALMLKSKVADSTMGRMILEMLLYGYTSSMEGLGAARKRSLKLCQVMQVGAECTTVYDQVIEKMKDRLAETSEAKKSIPLLERYVMMSTGIERTTRIELLFRTIDLDLKMGTQFPDLKAQMYRMFYEEKIFNLDVTNDIRRRYKEFPKEKQVDFATSMEIILQLLKADVNMAPSELYIRIYIILLNSFCNGFNYRTIDIQNGFNTYEDFADYDIRDDAVVYAITPVILPLPYKITVLSYQTEGVTAVEILYDASIVTEKAFNKSLFEFMVRNTQSLYAIHSNNYHVRSRLLRDDCSRRFNGLSSVCYSLNKDYKAFLYMQGAICSIREFYGGRAYSSFADSSDDYIKCGLKLYLTSLKSQADARGDKRIEFCVFHMLHICVHDVESVGFFSYYPIFSVLNEIDGLSDYTFVFVLSSNIATSTASEASVSFLKGFMSFMQSYYEAHPQYRWPFRIIELDISLSKNFRVMIPNEKLRVDCEATNYNKHRHIIDVTAYYEIIAANIELLSKLGVSQITWRGDRLPVLNKNLGKTSLIARSFTCVWSKWDGVLGHSRTRSLVTKVCKDEITELYAQESVDEALMQYTTFLDSWFSLMQIKKTDIAFCCKFNASGLLALQIKDVYIEDILSEHVMQYVTPIQAKVKDLEKGVHLEAQKQRVPALAYSELNRYIDFRANALQQEDLDTEQEEALEVRTKKVRRSLIPNDLLKDPKLGRDKRVGITKLSRPFNERNVGCSTAVVRQIDRNVEIVVQKEQNVGQELDIDLDIDLENVGHGDACLVHRHTVHSFVQHKHSNYSEYNSKIRFAHSFRGASEWGLQLIWDKFTAPILYLNIKHPKLQIQAMELDACAALYHFHKKGLIGGQLILQLLPCGFYLVNCNGETTLRYNIARTVNDTHPLRITFRENDTAHFPKLHNIQDAIIPDRFGYVVKQLNLCEEGRKLSGCIVSGTEVMLEKYLDYMIDIKTRLQEGYEMFKEHILGQYCTEADITYATFLSADYKVATETIINMHSKETNYMFFVLLSNTLQIASYVYLPDLVNAYSFFCQEILALDLVIPKECNISITGDLRSICFRIVCILKKIKKEHREFVWNEICEDRVDLSQYGAFQAVCYEQFETIIPQMNIKCDALQGAVLRQCQLQQMSYNIDAKMLYKMFSNIEIKNPRTNPRTVKLFIICLTRYCALAKHKTIPVMQFIDFIDLNDSSSLSNAYALSCMVLQEQDVEIDLQNVVKQVTCHGRDIIKIIDFTMLELKDVQPVFPNEVQMLGVTGLIKKGTEISSFKNLYRFFHQDLGLYWCSIDYIYRTSTIDVVTLLDEVDDLDSKFCVYLCVILPCLQDKKQRSQLIQRCQSNDHGILMLLEQLCALEYEDIILKTTEMLGLPNNTFLQFYGQLLQKLPVKQENKERGDFLTGFILSLTQEIQFVTRDFLNHNITFKKWQESTSNIPEQKMIIESMRLYMVDSAIREHSVGESTIQTQLIAQLRLCILGFYDNIEVLLEQQKQMERLVAVFFKIYEQCHGYSLEILDKLSALKKEEIDPLRVTILMENSIFYVSDQFYPTDLLMEVIKAVDTDKGVQIACTAFQILGVEHIKYSEKRIYIQHLMSMSSNMIAESDELDTYQQLLFSVLSESSVAQLVLPFLFERLTFFRDNGCNIIQGLQCIRLIQQSNYPYKTNLINGLLLQNSWHQDIISLVTLTLLAREISDACLLFSDTQLTDVPLTDVSKIISLLEKNKNIDISLIRGVFASWKDEIPESFALMAKWEPEQCDIYNFLLSKWLVGGCVTKEDLIQAIAILNQLCIATDDKMVKKSELEIIALLYTEPTVPDINCFLQLFSNISAVNRFQIIRDRISSYDLNPFGTRSLTDDFDISRIEDIVKNMQPLILEKDVDFDQVRAQVLEDILNINAFGFRTACRGNKTIKELTRSELLEWIKELKPMLAISESRHEGMCKIIAILREAYRRATGKFPYSSQIIPLLVCLHIQNPRQIIEMYTGQGKSILLALLNAIDAIEGYAVDICSCNNSLSYRDFLVGKVFFDYLEIFCVYKHANLPFDIEVPRVQAKPWSIVQLYQANDNENQQQVHYAPVYRQGGVYFCSISDASFFMARAMLEGYPLVSEAKRAISIDEIDVILRDMEEHRLSDAAGTIDNKYIELYAMVHAFYHQYQEKIDNCRDTAEIEYIAQALYMQIKEQNPALCTVLHEDFSDHIDRLAFWLCAARDGSKLKENAKFLKRETEVERYGKYEIAKVASIIKESDELSLESRFNDGVHQALHYRLGHSTGTNFLIEPEDMALTCSHTLELIRHYHRFHGASATLGDRADLQGLREDYGVGLAINIPPYQVCRRIEPTMLMYQDNESRYNALMEVLNYKFSQKDYSLSQLRERCPVLIICDTIDEVNAVYSFLDKNRKSLSFHHDIQTITAHDSNEGAIVDKVAHGSEIGVITIATQICGRGQDFKSRVCVILFAVLGHSNTAQVFGRCGRLGELGLAYSMLSKVEIQQKYGVTVKDGSESRAIVQVRTILREPECFNRKKMKIKVRGYWIAFDLFCRYKDAFRTSINETPITEDEDFYGLPVATIERVLDIVWCQFLFSDLRFAVIEQLDHITSIADLSQEVTECYYTSVTDAFVKFAKNIKIFDRVLLSLVPNLLPDFNFSSNILTRRTQSNIRQCKAILNGSKTVPVACGFFVNDKSKHLSVRQLFLPLDGEYSISQCNIITLMLAMDSGFELISTQNFDDHNAIDHTLVLEDGNYIRHILKRQRYTLACGNKLLLMLSIQGTTIDHKNIIDKVKESLSKNKEDSYPGYLVFSNDSYMVFQYKIQRVSHGNKIDYKFSLVSYRDTVMEREVTVQQKMCIVMRSVFSSISQYKVSGSADFLDLYNSLYKSYLYFIPPSQPERYVRDVPLPPPLLVVAIRLDESIKATTLWLKQLKIPSFIISWVIEHEEIKYPSNTCFQILCTEFDRSVIKTSDDLISKVISDVLDISISNLEFLTKLLFDDKEFKILEKQNIKTKTSILTLFLENNNALRNQLSLQILRQPGAVDSLLVEKTLKLSALSLLLKHRGDEAYEDLSLKILRQPGVVDSLLVEKTLKLSALPLLLKHRGDKDYEDLSLKILRQPGAVDSLLVEKTLKLSALSLLLKHRGDEAYEDLSLKILRQPGVVDSLLVEKTLKLSALSLLLKHRGDKDYEDLSLKILRQPGAVDSLLVEKTLKLSALSLLLKHRGDKDYEDLSLKILRQPGAVDSLLVEKTLKLSALSLLLKHRGDKDYEDLSLKILRQPGAVDSLLVEKTLKLSALSLLLKHRGDEAYEDLSLKILRQPGVVDSLLVEKTLKLSALPLLLKHRGDKDYEDLSLKILRQPGAVDSLLVEKTLKLSALSLLLKHRGDEAYEDLSLKILRQPGVVDSLLVEKTLKLSALSLLLKHRGDKDYEDLSLKILRQPGAVDSLLVEKTLKLSALSLLLKHRGDKDYEDLSLKILRQPGAVDSLLVEKTLKLSALSLLLKHRGDEAYEDLSLKILRQPGAVDSLLVEKTLKLSALPLLLKHRGDKDYEDLSLKILRQPGAVDSLLVEKTLKLSALSLLLKHRGDKDYEDLSLKILRQPGAVDSLLVEKTLKLSALSLLLKHRGDEAYEDLSLKILRQPGVVDSLLVEKTLKLSALPLLLKHRGDKDYEDLSLKILRQPGVVDSLLVEKTLKLSALPLLLKHRGDKDYEDLSLKILRQPGVVDSLLVEKTLKLSALPLLLKHRGDKDYEDLSLKILRQPGAVDSLLVEKTLKLSALSLLLKHRGDKDYEDLSLKILRQPGAVDSLLVEKTLKLSALSLLLKHRGDEAYEDLSLKILRQPGVVDSLLVEKTLKLSALPLLLKHRGDKDYEDSSLKILRQPGVVDSLLDLEDIKVSIKIALSANDSIITSQLLKRLHCAEKIDSLAKETIVSILNLLLHDFATYEDIIRPIYALYPDLSSSVLRRLLYQLDITSNSTSNLTAWSCNSVFYLGVLKTSSVFAAQYTLEVGLYLSCSSILATSLLVLTFSIAMVYIGHTVASHICNNDTVIANMISSYDERGGKQGGT